DVLLAARTDRAFRLQFGKDVLQPDAVIALDVEGFRKLPLAGAIGVFGYVAQDLLLGGQVRSVRPRRGCLLGGALGDPAGQMPNSLSFSSSSRRQRLSSSGPLPSPPASWAKPSSPPPFWSSTFRCRPWRQSGPAPLQASHWPGPFLSEAWR